MVNNNLKFAYLILAISFIFTSCSNEDDAGDIGVSQGEFDNGTFVLNEGSTDLSTASVSFIDENGTLSTDIFRAINPNAAEMGTYLQNIFFDEERAFIISGSANSITVVDRYTFEFITTISGDFQSPRYGTTQNGMAYVTNAADFSTGDDDYVSLINLDDYTTSQLPINNYAERVLSIGNNIYVANGAFGSGTAITVVDAATNSIIKTIDLGEGNSPNTIAEENGTLYVLTGSALIKIDTASNTITETVTLPAALAGSSNLQVEEGVIYFTSGTSVYTLGVNETAVNTEALITYESDSQFGSMYGFAVNDGLIYFSDAADFASSGTGYVYTTAGELQQTLTLGVGPNGFYFNN